MKSRPPAVTRAVSLLVGALAGVVGWAAFAPVDMWPAAIASMGLLAFALARGGVWMSYLTAFIFGLAMFAPMLWWARVSAGGVAWVFLTLGTAGLVGLVGPAWSLARRLPLLAQSRALGAVAFALIWTAVEEVRAVFPLGGFPWGRLAFSQASSPMARLTWLGGVSTTSFAVALAGALVGTVMVHARAGRTWAACAAALTGAVLVAGPILMPLDGRAEAGSLRVAAVQGGGEGDLPEGVTWQDAVLELHVGLTRDLVERLGREAVDLVIWPEDGAPFDFAKHPNVAALLGELSDAVGAPLLVGSTERPETGGRYNVSLIVTGPDGDVVARYAKRHPVPFGEYIPWRTVARALTDAVDRVSTDMLAGDEVGRIDLPVARTGGVVPLGDIICFEVVHDYLVTEAVAAGAQLLVVQTNNSSYKTTAESAQQLAMTRVRAIEQGRAAVHISTTGVSGMISPTGIVLDGLPAFTPGDMVRTLPLRTTLTPATRWGRTVSWTLAAMGAAVAAAGAARVIAQRRREE